VLPFHLSESDPNVKAKLVEEAEKAMKEQCPFRPKTNESLGKEALRQMLDDDDDDDDAAFRFDSYGDVVG
jgi:hypothetical protein